MGPKKVHATAHASRLALQERCRCGLMAPSSPDVEDDHFGGVHEDRGHVAGVLLVPAQS
jgi:hypothetical protein